MHRFSTVLWLKLLQASDSMQRLLQSVTLLTCGTLNPSWYAGRPRKFTRGPLNRWEKHSTTCSVAVVVGVLVFVVVSVDVAVVVGVLLPVDVPVDVGEDVAVDVPDVVPEDVAVVVAVVDTLVVGVVT